MRETIIAPNPTAPDIEAKAVFVYEELCPMLRSATGGFVVECWYTCTTKSTETVYIALCNGDRHEVNVSGDSPWAIAKDVMNAVAGWYE